MTDPTLKAKIQTALAAMDHSDAEQWTDDGLPRTSVVQTLANDPNVTRADITETDPGFQRTKPRLSADAIVASVKAAGPAVEPTTEGDGEYMTEDEVKAVLRQRVRDCEARLQAARDKITEGRSEEQAALRAVQEAFDDEKRQFPPMSREQNVKDYIASQNRRRAEVIAGRNIYGAPSQIDLAMSRGNSRGWKRPARSMIGAGA